MRKLLAYAAIYFLWGASFLAIREVVAVTPPFFAAAFRFLCAGGILYAYSRWQGVPQPDRRQWVGTAVLGLILFAGDYGCLFWAEKEVPSGLAAVIAATIPVWVLLGEWLFAGSQRPTAKALTGIVLGIAGVILLMLPAGLHNSAFSLSAMVLLLGCLFWSAGTVASRYLQLPRQLSMSSGLQMTWGGGFLLLLSAATGELGRLPGLAHQWTACGIRHGLSHPVCLHHCFHRLCLAYRPGSTTAFPAMPMSTRLSLWSWPRCWLTSGPHPCSTRKPLGSGGGGVHYCRQAGCAP